MEERILWTVVYIAPNRESATVLRETLGREGILVSIRPVSLQVQGEGINYEVMVPEAEAEEAQELLHAILQNTIP